MSLAAPPLKTKIPPESNPLKSRVLARRLAVDLAAWSSLNLCISERKEREREREKEKEKEKERKR